MSWNIIFFTKPDGSSPVTDFLRSLSPGHRAKAMRVIDLLEQYGPGLQRPHAASIRLKRYSGLWELRISFSGDASRVLYFTFNDGSFVLLHGFIKKTEKLPKKELEIALSRKLDFLKRCEK